VTGAEETLGGYQAVHGRPPAFEGADGCSYSAGIFSEDAPGPDGRYGAAVIFVRWSPSNEPDGHLETGFLAHDADPSRAEQSVGRMTLLDAKRHLDGLIAGKRSPEDS
jgi:hypothetical protein